LLPERVYKRAPDQDRLKQDQWSFILVVLSSRPSKPSLDRLVVTGLSGSDTRRSTTLPAKTLAGMDLIPKVPASPPRDRYRVAAFMIAESAPTDLAIDRVRCELSIDGGAKPLVRDVPIDVYVQKTSLIFPFEGHGMITQGGAWNDGHRNRSGMFAIDAIGLTALDAAMVGEGDANEAVAGWGRPILAPAAGKIVIARNDRPDQPVAGVSDPKYYVAEFPQGGDPGNHVVIDHGNGEFSMIAHFQHQSLRVREGDEVKQGQVLGLLGNSGDSSDPHVHHQLQSGPQWTSSDALPHVYVNGPGRRHDRGAFFVAKKGSAS
jgi:hypothetical protein